MTERLANLFQFIDVERRDPEKRSMQTRTEEFVEIYDPFTQQTAKEQSHRCLECGNPYCEWKCPVHNLIPNWLKLLAEGRLFEADIHMEKFLTAADGQSEITRSALFKKI